MRHRVAFAVLVGVVVIAVAGWQVTTADLPQHQAPNATFVVEGDPGDGELVVEHAGGDPLASGSLRVLVYEDRPVVPDRPVHGSVWETNGTVGPGDRIALEDERFEPGQRLVVRWYGEAGQANIYETIL